MHPLIALITDFGYSDPFVGAVKGAIKTIAPETEIIDISHDVDSFSIDSAQYLLHATHRHFPPGTIFCVVVDPGVGTERRGLVAHDGRHLFVMPDNGIISAVRSPAMTVHAIDMIAFPDASATFHGRDVFATVAARLGLGSSPDEFGPPAGAVIERPFPWHDTSGGAWRCRVIHIDRFGNATFSLPVAAISPGRGARFVITTARGSFHAACAATYGDLKPGEFGLISGSSGFVELAADRSSAAASCALRPGDEISIISDGAV